jgi:hypothetical protein
MPANRQRAETITSSPHCCLLHSRVRVHDQQQQLPPAAVSAMPLRHRHDLSNLDLHLDHAPRCTAASSSSNIKGVEHAWDDVLPQGKSETDVAKTIQWGAECDMNRKALGSE